MLKKLIKQDYPEYLDYYQKFTELSYFRLTAIGGMTEIDLAICDNDPDTEMFMLMDEVLQGFLTFSPINRADHNAYFYLYIQEDYVNWKNFLEMFMQGFCDRNKLYKLQSLVLPEDSFTIRLLEIVGFVKEGCLKGQHYLNGGFHDLLIYGRPMKK